MADVDDIFRLFMKMQSGSCSKLGPQQEHKLFWMEFSSCILKNYIQSWIFLGAILNILSAKSDVICLKRKKSKSVGDLDLGSEEKKRKNIYSEPNTQSVMCSVSVEC